MSRMREERYRSVRQDAVRPIGRDEAAQPLTGSSLLLLCWYMPRWVCPKKHWVTNTNECFRIFLSLAPLSSYVLVYIFDWMSSSYMGARN